MAITAMVGRPGQGKSVWLVSEIERWLSKGYVVYTNIDINDQWLLNKYDGKLFKIESIEDIVQLRTGKIILDEVQTYLNSRNWDKLDVRLQLLLQQHRKRGLDIIGATQSIRRADVVFRELVQYFYRINRIFAFRIPFTTWAFGAFYIYEYDPDDIESQTAVKTEKALTWIPWFFFPGPRTFRIYDTTQEYAPAVREGERYLEEYVIAKKTTEVRQLVDRKKISAPPPNPSVN